MSSVTYDHVTKEFGNVRAVNDLNMEIADKEFLVFVGPSGCGKTTALKLREIVVIPILAQPAIQQA